MKHAIILFQSKILCRESTQTAINGNGDGDAVLVVVNCNNAFASQCQSQRNLNAFGKLFFHLLEVSFSF